MKKLFLFLLFSAVCFAQLDNLQKIKIDEINFTDFERSFVFDGAGSFYYFYRQQGSTAIKVAESEDYGQTWNSLHEITGLVLPSSNPRSYDIIQAGYNTFIIGYLNFTSNLQLFNYNVTHNTLEQIGNDHQSSSGSHDIELIQVDSTTFIASIKDNQNNVFYFKTTDNAQTWSSKLTIPDFTTGEKAVSMTYHNDVLYAVQAEDDIIKINSSSDQGESWGSTSAVYSSDVNLPYASIHSNDSNLYLIFEKENYVDLIDDYQTDIFYMYSMDNGITWSDESNYTEFIGDDKITEICYSMGWFIACKLIEQNQLRKNGNLFRGFIYIRRSSSTDYLFHGSAKFSHFR
ncbi:MAG: hypothetical protein U5K00_17880 [Melioribacteraceae bacterium]|nr:hypothetical protein [Melioribacteraceae bacterium]